MAVTKNNALITLGQAKAFVGMPSTVTENDDLLVSLIDSASQLIETFCNRKFRSADYDEVYDGSKVKTIPLKQWPVVQIDLVNEDSNRDFAAATDLVANTYRILFNEDQEGIALQRLDRSFSNGLGTIKVKYNAGYSLTDIPSDLALGCSIAVAYYFQRVQNKDWTQKAKGKRDERITLIASLPEACIELIHGYKRLDMIAPPKPEQNR